jgi:hypothetical protein
VDLQALVRPKQRSIKQIGLLGFWIPGHNAIVVESLVEVLWSVVREMGSTISVYPMIDLAPGARGEPEEAGENDSADFV